MNNTLIIKNADFSAVKVGKLNIQKVNVVKAGNGGMLIENYELAPMSNIGTFYPNEEVAYSEIVSVPEGAKYLYVHMPLLISNAGVEELLDPTVTSLANSRQYYGIIYHRTDTDYWYRVAISYITRPTIIDIYHNVYSNTFSVVLLDGGVFTKNVLASTVDKFMFNWVRPDAKVAGGLGMEVPEVYFGF